MKAINYRRLNILGSISRLPKILGFISRLPKILAPISRLSSILSSSRPVPPLSSPISRQPRFGEKDSNQAQGNGAQPRRNARKRSIGERSAKRKLPGDLHAGHAMRPFDREVAAFDFSGCTYPLKLPCLVWLRLRSSRNAPDRLYQRP